MTVNRDDADGDDALSPKLRKLVERNMSGGRKEAKPGGGRTLQGEGFTRGHRTSSALIPTV